MKREKNEKKKLREIQRTDFEQPKLPPFSSGNSCCPGNIATACDFPAISLLLVAYIDRLKTITERIRSLHAQYAKDPDELLVSQIGTLRKRLYLVRNMQACGVAGFFFCVLCLFILFSGSPFLGKLIISITLVLLMIASFSLFGRFYCPSMPWRVQISDMENKLRKK